MTILKLVFALATIAVYAANSTSVVDSEVSKTVSFSFHGNASMSEEPYTIIHETPKDKAFALNVAIHLAQCIYGAHDFSNLPDAVVGKGWHSDPSATVTIIVFFDHTTKVIHVVFDLTDTSGNTSEISF